MMFKEGILILKVVEILFQKLGTAISNVYFYYLFCLTLNGLMLLTGQTRDWGNLITFALTCLGGKKSGNQDFQKKEENNTEWGYNCFGIHIYYEAVF